MIAKCTFCDDVFETHAGGSVCQRCKKVACPVCEETMFPRNADGNFDILCKDCREKVNTAAVREPCTCGGYFPPRR